MQVGKAPHEVALPGCRIGAGDPVLLLHFWNEHLPPIPLEGPTVIWAAHFGRRLKRSFYTAARYMASDSRLAQLRAVGGALALLSANELSGSVQLMQRLGLP